ncbi:MAG: ATP-binding protein [Hyphomicrobiaceae bacterium]|nr:ATP-binding protein [Hyphomicrobiaceae bacterium]
MVVFAVLAAVLLLPLAGLIFFRLFENELVRQTESELIAQSAVLAAAFSEQVKARLPDGIKLGAIQDKNARPSPWRRYTPQLPTIDLARDNIKGPRPDATLAKGGLSPQYRAIGAQLDPLVQETQKLTLAGFRILDPEGRIIVGRGDIGMSLAQVAEVSAALEGRYSSVLRERISDSPPPPLYSISRGTTVRVFTAMPVIVDGRVAGVIYASRTPSNIVKYLYGERRNVFFAGLAIVLAALVIGTIFLRTITRPLIELIARTDAIKEGDRTAIRPLAHSGTREIAQLSSSFFAMARSLFERSDFIANFAAHVSHELKSPLTSIQGAAELLRDSETKMKPVERKRFFNNIIDDTQRLSVLLQRLRELARADGPHATGNTSLSAMEGEIAKTFPSITVEIQGERETSIPISSENMMIVLAHLLDNAVQHGAKHVTIMLEEDVSDLTVKVSDDGEGITEHNRSKIFDSFFTTRREQGGTGMGLGIARTILHAHGGTIALAPAEAGASFEIRVPKAE